MCHVRNGEIGEKKIPITLFFSWFTGFDLKNAFVFQKVPQFSRFVSREKRPKVRSRLNTLWKKK